MPVVCFENDTVLGFVNIFDKADSLVEGWEKAQQSALAEFRPQLIGAGEKAWNVYSIFVTPNVAQDRVDDKLDRIEENFKLTRKIARAGILTKERLESALLPLLPIQNRPKLADSRIEERLMTALSAISEDGAEAFMKDVKPVDIAHILADR